MDLLFSLRSWLLTVAVSLFRVEPTFVFQVYGPIDSETLRIVAGWFVTRAIIAVPIAYFAKRKGYSFWGFFLVAWMFMPAASIAMILALPKLEGDKVVPSDRRFRRA